VFVNVAGGIKIVEPASDLGVVAAIWSSFNNRSLDHETIFIGEVGLTGEVRAVQGVDVRLKEASKMGFTRAVVPKSNLKQKPSAKIEVTGISHVEELLKVL